MGDAAEPLADLGNSRILLGILAHGGHPQPMRHASVVDHRGDGRRRCYVSQPGRDLTGRIVPEPDDRTRVDARRAEEPVAILARLGEGTFVGADPAPGAEGLEGDAGENAASCRDVLGVRHAIRLLVRVQGGAGIASEHAVSAPCREGPRRAPVALIGPLPRLVLRQVERGRRCVDRGRGAVGEPPGR